MEFSEVLRRRRTVRHVTDQPLVPEVVERGHRLPTLPGGGEPHVPRTRP